MGKQNRRNRNNKQKSDNIEVKGKLDSTNFKQNPNWYFKDAVQAESMSRIQMNAFGALTKHAGHVMPTVCAFYANPCPGVTDFNLVNDDDIIELPWDAQSKGINRAAQKLWYILTCKSGRSAGYTKSDVALLILSMGAMIETYEFIRRAFGIAYTYNQRNRALPTMLYRAMSVDMDDYQENAATYLKRMNSLMAIMNQLPMPGNIAWFAKCQDLYQNIYMDYPSEMAQLFIVSPSTTWVLEENDGFIGGSYLRTVDMCVEHRNSDDGQVCIGRRANDYPIMDESGDWYTTSRYHGIGSSGVNEHNVFPLSHYIDVFEEQINNLLFSSTFSQIYSDLLRAFDNGTLSRWTFDYIDEKYNIAPVFDDNRLWMFHNATVAAGILSYSREYWQSKFDKDETGNPTYPDPVSFRNSFKSGTPCNDVYQWGPLDVIIYNPCLNTSTTTNSGSIEYRDGGPFILDFPSDNPTTEERIEYTRYCFTGYSDTYPHPAYPDGYDGLSKVAGFNFNLPDHWFELGEVYFGRDDDTMMLADRNFISNEVESNITDGDGTSPVVLWNEPWVWSKFHHSKLLRDCDGTFVGDVVVMGELNSWTTVSSDWFKDINDMIYVDLFDIR